MPSDLEPSKSETLTRYGLVIARIMLVFGGVGPLIGLLVFASGIAVLGTIQGGANGLMVAVFVMIFGMIFAHFIGGVAALVAGAAAAILTLLVGRPDRWIGLVSGVVAVVFALVTGSLHPPPLPKSGAALDLLSFKTFFWMLMLTVHLASAVACWEITRRLDVSPKQGGTHPTA